MTVAELKAAVLALDSEEKKTFILETLPPLAQDAIMTDPSFLSRLLPVFLELVKDSGLDLQQLLQLAALFGDGRTGDSSAA